METDRPDEETLAASLIPTERFDSYATPLPSVILRTEPNTPPSLLHPPNLSLFYHIVDIGRQFLSNKRHRDAYQQLADIDREQLVAFGQIRRDFRGLGFTNEDATVSVFPVEQPVDADALQQALGNDTFMAVTQADTLIFRVNIDGHPQQRQALEESLRRTVRTNLQLDSEEANRRIQVERKIQLRRPLFQTLLARSPIQLPSGLIPPPLWRAVVRETKSFPSPPAPPS